MVDAYNKCPILENKSFLKDYFHACGLLSLDLRSDYENETKDEF